MIEINVSPVKSTNSGQKVRVRGIKPAQNGHSGNGNGRANLNDGNGNNAAIAARYLERVLSNFYLASYVSYTFLRAFDKTNSPARIKTRLMLFQKGILDIILSLVGLILSLPFYLLIAALIKLDSEGPVFYRQERIGQNRRRNDRRRFQLDMASDRRLDRDRRREDYYGKPFVVHKFRTMRKDAEKKCGPVWATKDDPRITRIGRFLRRTRIDELPQLWNVLKGEMSLVGPRPERYYFIRNYAKSINCYTIRFSFKPGITGLAQVQSGYDSSDETVKRKLSYDLSYISDWRLGRDIRILAKTTLVIITGKGAL